MPFDRAVAPGQSQCRFHGMLIAQEAGCEAAEGGMFGTFKPLSHAARSRLRTRRKPVPHAAELAAISLLPEFSPELTDVVASLMKALVQIPDVGINRVGVRTRGAFRHDAGTCPSLHGAQTEVELSSDIGLARSAVGQSFHLLI